MENADVFGSSTAPLTWHDFLERMRQPSAADFVKAIKRYYDVSDTGIFLFFKFHSIIFQTMLLIQKGIVKAVQEFLGNMEAAFRAHSLWAGCSEDELESVRVKLSNIFLKMPPVSAVKSSRSDDFLLFLYMSLIKANPPQLHSNLLYYNDLRHENVAYFRRQSVLLSQTFFRRVLSSGTLMQKATNQMDETEFKVILQSAQASSVMAFSNSSSLSSTLPWLLKTKLVFLVVSLVLPQYLTMNDQVLAFKGYKVPQAPTHILLIRKDMRFAELAIRSALSAIGQASRAA
nr:vacuolar protein sorting-associated protein 9A-like [Ipomoea batatas]